MGYIDFSDAELRALTRQRREELRLRRLAAIPQPVRYSGPTVEYARPCGTVAWSKGSQRRKTASRAWRVAQWKAGKRECGYCQCTMTFKEGPRQATCDHRVPLSARGADAARNWLLCCWTCNNRKGSMSEADYRDLLRSERVARAA